MKKLNKILLIDDDYPTNLLHQILIGQSKCAEGIETIRDVSLALEYIQSKESSVSMPELILLDLNMPRLDGWHFLEKIEEKIKTIQPKPKIYILTTSESIEDKERANAHPLVNGLLVKPLTKANLLEIVESV